VANGQGFNQFKIIDQADRLTRSPERIPQDEDIQAANELYKEMFGYDLATGRFKEVLGPTRSGAPISPIDILKRYKDMNRNVLELRLGDRFIGPIESLHRKPEFDWGAIGAGVSKILDKKQRDEIFNEVAIAEQEGTRVEIGEVPGLKPVSGKPYKASYEGLDPEDPEDQNVIAKRLLLESFINQLKEMEKPDKALEVPELKDEGLPMRTKSLQEWMFNR
jgi:hypothetical protein